MDTTFWLQSRNTQRHELPSVIGLRRLEEPGRDRRIIRTDANLSSNLKWSYFG